MSSNTNNLSDIYLERMVADLAKAEEKLRSDIEYRGMSFSQQRLDDSQANVGRLHELIRSYKAGSDQTRRNLIGEQLGRL
jgi:hypothetical protein